MPLMPVPNENIDGAIEKVVAKLLRMDPSGSKFSDAIARSYSTIYNGQETGRYLWADLMKTEKTHFGTLFEMNVQRNFRFKDGKATDFDIAGHQVDAKWSQTVGAWMLPPEVYGKLALVATGNEALGFWSVGLIRVKSQYRAEGKNRDKKSKLNKLARDSVRWIWKDEPLPNNALLAIPPWVMTRVMSGSSGTRRTDELFRVAQLLLVSRIAVATVSQQLDAQKRVRYNGGSRSALRSEGFIILSGTYHRHLALTLGVPVPSATEYVSLRVVKSEVGVGALIDGGWWRSAAFNEPSLSEAPRIPERGAR